jgi:hypothetical protein
VSILVPASIAQQKNQLTEALDLSRSRLKANLSRQRISTVTGKINREITSLFKSIGYSNIEF